MQFIRADWGEAVAAVSERLVNELRQGHRVLWLVSGGSQIAANVQIMSSIDEGPSQNLSVGLVDERYGPVGHPDSNWTQLIAAGFPAKQATMLPALKEGLDFAANIAYYNDLITTAFANNDRLIGQLGLGIDGHTAGILPHSPACSDSDSFVTGYEAPPRQRLTLTFLALKELTAAYVLAFGDDKLETLTNLQSKELSVTEQPAQILKALPEVYLYNDQVGGD